MYKAQQGQFAYSSIQLNCIVAPYHHRENQFYAVKFAVPKWLFLVTFGLAGPIAKITANIYADISDHVLANREILIYSHSDHT